MQLYFLTSVGWSLDASGNLQAIDTAGNLLAKFIGGAFSSKLNRPGVLQNTPITTTTSTTTVHSGFYVNITPQASGGVLILSVTACSNNTANDGAITSILYKAGTLSPAGGGSTAGWTKLSAIQIGQTLAVNEANNSLVGVDAYMLTGLTVGSAYTISLGYQVTTGGTGTFTVENNTPIVVEI